MRINHSAATENYGNASWRMHFVHLRLMSAAWRGVWGIGTGRDKTLLARSEVSAEMFSCVHALCAQSSHCCLVLARCWVAFTPCYFESFDVWGFKIAGITFSSWRFFNKQRFLDGSGTFLRFVHYYLDSDLPSAQKRDKENLAPLWLSLWASTVWSLHLSCGEGLRTWYIFDKDR